ncbi:hypothetical protein Ae201684P_010896 [Aphanomyces euteiches]|nr:hypothetical protein Ae201684P_010896 [Aphanomyces euteiches]
MNTLFSKIAACRDTLDGYSGAYHDSALKKLRSSLKRAKMESKDVVVEHMLPLAASVKSKLLSSLDATVVQARGVVASFARQLGAAFAPFADVLLVRSWTLLVCVATLAATTLLSVETLYAYFKTARATPQPSYRRGMEAPSCGEATWHHCRDMHEGRVGATVFTVEGVRAKRSTTISCWSVWKLDRPERVNEFVYLPAPRIRAVLMADGYATTGIGLALQRKFQSKTPAAVKRPPKVVGPLLQSPNVVDFTCLLFCSRRVAVWQRLPSFGRRMSKVEQQPRAIHQCPRGSSSRLGIDQASNDASALEGATPLAPMDDVQVVNLLLR